MSSHGDGENITPEVVGSEGVLTNSTFNELLGLSFTKALVDLLGTTGAEVVTKRTGLGRHPTDPSKIEGALVEVFRVSGARVIERQVLKELFDRVNERFGDDAEVSFVEQVEGLKRLLGPREGDLV